MVISPDSSMLYAEYYAQLYTQPVIAFIDTQTLQVVQTYSPTFDFSELGGVSPDGSQLYMTGFPSATTSLFALNTATLAITTIPIPIDGVIATVSPNGLVYVAGYFYVASTLSDTAAQLVVYDPASQTVSAPAPLLSNLNNGSLAVSSDGSHVYRLNTQTSSLALLEPPPSETVLDTVQMGLNGNGNGVYDHKDNLILLPDHNGYIDIFDAATLRLNGLLYIEGFCGWVAFGDAGYALGGNCGYAPTSPQVIRFDPVSLQVTGSVPLPAGYEFQSFTQPALNGNRLYVPFGFSGYLEPLSGIAVIDTAQMQLVTTWPFDYLPYLAVAPDGGQGYVVGFRGSGYRPTVLKIDMGTGQVVQSIQMPVWNGSDHSLLALSPDGGTIYVSLNSTLYAISSQSMTVANSAAGLDLSTLSVSPDGQYLYGLLPGCPNCTPASTLDIISTSSLQVVGTIQSAQLPGPVIFIEQ